MVSRILFRDMLNLHPFSSWTHVLAGATLFAMLFELPLIMVDYLIEGTIGLSWSTLAFGGAAFVGYVLVGGIVMWRSDPTDAHL